MERVKSLVLLAVLFAVLAFELFATLVLLLLLVELLLLVLLLDDLLLAFTVVVLPLTVVYEFPGCGRLKPIVALEATCPLPSYLH